MLCPRSSQLCFWPFLSVSTVSLLRLSPCRSLAIVFFFFFAFLFFLFLPSFLPFILVDVAVGTDPSLPPHSNWLPGSHHCHFLITHNPLWASLYAGAVRPPNIDAQTHTHTCTQSHKTALVHTHTHTCMLACTLVHTDLNVCTLNYAHTHTQTHTHTLFQ